MDGRILHIALGEEKIREEKVENFSIPSLYSFVDTRHVVFCFHPSGGLLALYISRQDGKLTRDFVSTRLACHMAGAGVVAMIVSGVGRKLSWLSVVEDHCELKHCGSIRFSQPQDFVRLLAESEDDGFLAIGEAGEKLSPLSTCCCDNNSTVGRGGLASILGSMNFKGVISHSSAVLQPLLQRKKYRSALARDLKLYGSATLVDYGVKNGWLPKKYFKPFYDPRAFFLDGKQTCREYNVEHNGCPSCQILCKLSDKGSDLILPSWQDAMALGSNLGIYSVGKVRQLLSACHDYGLDSCDMGEMLSFLNTQDNLDYTMPTVKGCDVAGLLKVIAGFGSGKYLLSLASFEDAMSLDGRSCIYDFRGAHVQALFSCLGETTPCYVDLVMNLKKVWDTEKAGRACAWLRVYTHAMENLGYPAILMLPMYFESHPLRLYRSMWLFRRLMQGFKIEGYKNADLLKLGVESIDAFDARRGEMAELPAFFQFTGRTGYTDEVNIHRLKDAYSRELDYIRSVSQRK